MKITEKKISEKLRSLGIPANLLGFNYIKTAILLVESDTSYLHNIMKGLYPEIAIKYSTDKCRVERAIRHAIDKMYLSGDEEEIRTLGVPSKRKEKLTCGEFLGALYECLRYD